MQFLKKGGGGGGGTGMTPQTGTGSPEGVVTTRFAGDQYIDTTGLKGVKLVYQNPNASGNTGWVIIQSTPA